MGLGELARRHLPGELVVELSRIFMAVGAGEIVKGVCGNIILGNALAGCVHHAEAELRLGVTLSGGASGTELGRLPYFSLPAARLQRVWDESSRSIFSRSPTIEIPTT